MKPCLSANTHRSSTVILGVVLLAGCASRSLNPPQVVEWSSGARPPVSAATPGTGNTVFYSVTRGDALASIAARFRVSPGDLAAWNGLPPNPRLTENQVLRVSPPDASRPVDANPVAITQPIGGDTIEQRPIGTAPPSASSNVPDAAVPASSSNAPLKSGPLGFKKPYSDTALAELSRPDPDAAQVPPNSSPPPLAPPAPVVPSDVSWAWPSAGKPSTAFADKTKGIDLAGKAGDPVLAAADGKVTFAGTGVRGYGNFVIVQHSPDLLSVYAHNRANLVKEGTLVTKGQKIAEMGASDTDAVKLHFEIRRDSKPVDPLQYLPPR